jgi:hypothetical protein
MGLHTSARLYERRAFNHKFLQTQILRALCNAISYLSDSYLNCLELYACPYANSMHGPSHANIL